jgi:hypothetical protein
MSNLVFTLPETRFFLSVVDFPVGFIKTVRNATFPVGR